MTTSWMQLVKEIYNKNKNQPGYRFKNALTDAAKIYKKHKRPYTHHRATHHRATHHRATRRATPYYKNKGGSYGVSSMKDATVV